MAKKENFRNWRVKFERSRPGALALQSLAKGFPSGTENKQDGLLAYPLRDEVLASCYAAAMFIPNEDAGKTKRRAGRDALRALPKLRDAVTTLRQLVRQHPSAVEKAFGQASLDLKKEGITIAADDLPNDARLLNRVLEAFSSRLVPPIPFVATGNAVHRYTYGCLQYNSPLDDGAHNRLAEVETMLLFDLVQIFRLQSQKKRFRRQSGESMPKSGKPHYALAATFVNATFSTRLSERQASSRLKDFLRKNPGVGYHPWDDLPGPFDWTTK